MVLGGYRGMRGELGPDGGCEPRVGFPHELIRRQEERKPPLWVRVKDRGGTAAVSEVAREGPMRLAASVLAGRSVGRPAFGATGDSCLAVRKKDPRFQHGFAFCHPGQHPLYIQPPPWERCFSSFPFRASPAAPEGASSAPFEYGKTQAGHDESHSRERLS